MEWPYHVELKKKVLKNRKLLTTAKKLTFYCVHASTKAS